jgi:hypothetical protein
MDAKQGAPRSGRFVDGGGTPPLKRPDAPLF